MHCLLAIVCQHEEGAQFNDATFTPHPVFFLSSSLLDFRNSFHSSVLRFLHLSHQFECLFHFLIYFVRGDVLGVLVAFAFPFPLFVVEAARSTSLSIMVGNTCRVGQSVTENCAPSINLDTHVAYQ